MVSSLDDQMLDELMQVVMMEKEARKVALARSTADPGMNRKPLLPLHLPLQHRWQSAMKAELEKYQEKLANRKRMLRSSRNQLPR